MRGLLGPNLSVGNDVFVLFVIVMIVLREVGQLKACMVARFLFSTAIECIG
jgi:hypothetical protein